MTCLMIREDSADRTCPTFDKGTVDSQEAALRTSWVVPNQVEKEVPSWDEKVVPSQEEKVVPSRVEKVVPSWDEKVVPSLEEKVDMACRKSLAVFDKAFTLEDRDHLMDCDRTAD